MPAHTPAEQARSRTNLPSQASSTAGTATTSRTNITPVGKPSSVRRRVSGARKPKALPGKASTKARPGVPAQASSTARGKLSELFKGR